MFTGVPRLTTSLAAGIWLDDLALGVDGLAARPGRA